MSPPAPRRSTSRARPTEMSEIAAGFGCGNVLQGSVRRAGNRVRVTVQLVDAEERLSTVVRALRPADGGHFRDSGRDRAGDHRCGSSVTARRRCQAIDQEPRSLRAVPEGPSLLASAIAGHAARWPFSVSSRPSSSIPSMRSLMRGWRTATGSSGLRLDFGGGRAAPAHAAMTQAMALVATAMGSELLARASTFFISSANGGKLRRISKRPSPSIPALLWHRPTTRYF